MAASPISRGDDPDPFPRFISLDLHTAAALLKRCSPSVSQGLNLGEKTRIGLILLGGWVCASSGDAGGKGGQGLVFMAHRLLYHSTLDLRVIKKKTKKKEGG